MQVRDTYLGGDLHLLSFLSLSGYLVSVVSSGAAIDGEELHSEWVATFMVIQITSHKMGRIRTHMDSTLMIFVHLIQFIRLLHIQIRFNNRLFKIIMDNSRCLTSIMVSNRFLSRCHINNIELNQIYILNQY